jgi:hypothetical protein
MGSVKKQLRIADQAAVRNLDFHCLGSLSHNGKSSKTQ